MTAKWFYEVTVTTKKMDGEPMTQIHYIQTLDEVLEFAIAQDSGRHPVEFTFKRKWFKR